METPFKTILVTGASSFIGRNLIKKLFLEGYEVIALNRSGSYVEGSKKIISWDLSDPLANINLKCDIAIHLAYDYNGEKGANITISGTKTLFEYLYVNGGTKRQLFITSYSAGNHATSRYGKTKSVLEEYLLKDKRTIIVRPGLVLGEGGIFSRISNFVNKSPIVPLPDGGKGCVSVITIERLCNEIIKLCKANNPTQIANLFEPQKVQLRDLLKNSSLVLRRSFMIINIPSLLLLFIIRMIEFLGIKLPVSSDSLAGFIQNQSGSHISILKKEKTSK